MAQWGALASTRAEPAEKWHGGACYYSAKIQKVDGQVAPVG